jgi:His/Glu/Gln/Arg/opine family amino acid ABC transporter permease subunit
MLYGYGPLIAGGVWVTLQLTLGALMVATALGIASALANTSGTRIGHLIAVVYSTLIRGLPELVLMLSIFYGGQYFLNQLTTLLGIEVINVSPMVAGTLTIGFIYGAYLSETFRGAIISVARGQVESARACGFSARQVTAHIVLPQMLRHALPGVTNTWLVMIKASALVSMIGLNDMVHRANLAASSTRAPFTFYMVVAAIYLSITTVSLIGLGLVQRRVSAGVPDAAL